MLCLVLGIVEAILRVIVEPNIKWTSLARLGSEAKEPGKFAVFDVANVLLSPRECCVCVLDPMALSKKGVF